jgi:hypothetical protein
MSYRAEVRARRDGLYEVVAEDGRRMVVARVKLDLEGIQPQPPSVPPSIPRSISQPQQTPTPTPTLHATLLGQHPCPPPCPPTLYLLLTPTHQILPLKQPPPINPLPFGSQLLLTNVAQVEGKQYYRCEKMTVLGERVCPLES